MSAPVKQLDFLDLYVGANQACQQKDNLDGIMQTDKTNKINIFTEHTHVMVSSSVNISPPILAPDKKYGD